MTIRYQEKQIKDVALPISRLELTPQMSRRVALDFVDLFAADNPIRCRVVGGHDTPCGIGCLSDGFDRERFLVACGLESEGWYGHNA